MIITHHFNMIRYFIFIIILCLISPIICQEADITQENELQALNNNETNHTVNVSQAETAQSTNHEMANSTLNTTSVQNSTESTNASQKLIRCIPQTGPAEVQLVNETELIRLTLPQANITSRDVPANCVLALFYSKFCPFSSMAAPHFNALPRAFPQIKMVAIDAMVYNIFNAQNGIVGVPTLLLIHNGRPVAKFNETEYTLELFSKFVTKFTGIMATEMSYVTSADFSGPVVSVPAKDFDIFLIISWIFIVICAIYYFMQSKYCKWIVETIQSNWRESAQHEHAE